MSKIRIGIIGGGASGATACKACLEEGFDVVVYEKTHYTGGLWRYHDEDVEGVASVAKSTIINSSKEMSAFSDFPPPPEFPNYMHNTKMVKYFDLYGEKFGYERFVRFRHEVLKVEPNADYDETGKWIITVKDQKSGQTIQDVVNGVMVCTGHHIQPLVPTFEGQDKFRGQILHTHSYKRPDSYADKKVVVVGIGNSGGDAAVELSTTAEKVYLSVRRGTWIVHRVGPNGKPFDSLFIRRPMNLLFNYLPYSLTCSVMEWGMNREETETPCDVVLLATGYRVSFPFFSQSLIPTDKNQVQLYKHMFSPKLKHPKTLAFISLAQPIGALLPIGEMQSRWFAQLMSNKLKLPDFETMMRDIENKKRFQKRFYESERHTIQVDWLNFMDELAIELGVKPNLMKYFLTDPELWRSLFFGPSVPYQYRLEGPHSWSGARDAILNVNERISAPLKTRIPEPRKDRGNKNMNLMTSLIGLICFLLIAFLLNYLF